MNDDILGIFTICVVCSVPYDVCEQNQQKIHVSKRKTLSF